MDVEVLDETSHVNKSNIKYIRRKIRFKNTNDFYNLINCDNTKNKKFIVVSNINKKIAPIYYMGAIRLLVEISIVHLLDLNLILKILFFQCILH